MIFFFTDAKGDDANELASNMAGSSGTVTVHDASCGPTRRSGSDRRHPGSEVERRPSSGDTARGCRRSRLLDASPLPEGLAVLDVREHVEWAHGHIEGSVHIPLTELMERLAEVPDAQTLVVCKVGARSAHAAAYLLQQGRDAVNLDGGLLEWEAAGRAL